MVRQAFCECSFSSHSSPGKVRLWPRVSGEAGWKCSPLHLRTVLGPQVSAMGSRMTPHEDMKQTPLVTSEPQLGARGHPGAFSWCLAGTDCLSWVGTHFMHKELKERWNELAEVTQTGKEPSTLQVQ